MVGSSWHGVARQFAGGMAFALAEYFDDASANTYLRCQVRGRAKGAETVSMKFNRLFTETKRSYTRPPHFRYFASQEVSTAVSLLNAQRYRLIIVWFEVRVPPGPPAKNFAFEVICVFRLSPAPSA